MLSKFLFVLLIHILGSTSQMSMLFDGLDKSNFCPALGRLYRSGICQARQESSYKPPEPKPIRRHKRYYQGGPRATSLANGIAVNGLDIPTYYYNIHLCRDEYDVRIKMKIVDIKLWISLELLDWDQNILLHFHITPHGSFVNERQNYVGIGWSKPIPVYHRDLVVGAELNVKIGVKNRVYWIGLNGNDATIGDHFNRRFNGSFFPIGGKRSIGVDAAFRSEEVEVYECYIRGHYQIDPRRKDCDYN